MGRYGSQNNGQYSMENFIVQVLELDMGSEYVRMMDADERTDYIINKAVEAINIGPKEIHFTPYEDNEYKKIKAIYDKLADDLKKMVCIHMGFSPCPFNSDKVIQEAVQRFPDIRFKPGMTFGYKLKAIENYLENKTKTETKGGRKTRRRLMSKKKTKSRRKNITKSKGKKGKQAKKVKEEKEIKFKIFILLDI